MSALLEVFKTRLQAGLQRKAITTASKWAEKYRIHKGLNWDFSRFPWTKEMHDSDAPLSIGQKSAQMGFTEVVLNRTFFMMDVGQVDCLYVLPSKIPDAGNFSRGRFDSAIDESPHLYSLFSDIKNIDQKKAGTVSLYIRGSMSRSGLKSLPVGFLVLDELDEFDQDNIQLAIERTSGQLKKWVWMISTPTIEDKGINKYFKYSTQEHFFFKCPCCAKHIELKFPESLVITADSHDDPNIVNSHLICYECKGRLTHNLPDEDQRAKEKVQLLKKALWVPKKPEMLDRGFHVNQLYSTTIQPHEIAGLYLKSEFDPADEQEFFNSKLGLTHVTKGAKVDDDNINSCIGRPSYKLDDKKFLHGFLTMGIDMGKVCHYEVDWWHIPKDFKTMDLNMECVPFVVASGKTNEIDDLEEIWKTWKPNATVIDGGPELRTSYNFACKFPNVWCNFYTKNDNSKRIDLKASERQVNSNRTSWLDCSLSRFRSSQIKLPIDVSNEYRAHIKNLVKVPKKKEEANEAQYMYLDIGPDHFAHARNYAEIALPIGLSSGKVQSIKLS